MLDSEVMAGAGRGPRDTHAAGAPALPAPFHAGYLITEIRNTSVRIRISRSLNQNIPS